MTPEEVLALRWRPHENEVNLIGVPTPKIIRAYVHWEQGKGYFVCPERENTYRAGSGCQCGTDSKAYLKFVMPIVVTVGSTPILKWWEFGERNYRMLVEHVRRYPSDRYDISISVQDAQYARYLFHQADHSVWLPERDLWKQRAEELLQQLPLWRGFQKPSNESPGEVRLDRIGLLLFT